MAMRPSIIVAILMVYVALVRWSKISDQPLIFITAFVSLVLIVFATYFILAAAGFRVSQRGNVDVPRIYAWSLVFLVFVVVFGGLFYLITRGN